MKLHFINKTFEKCQYFCDARKAARNTVISQNSSLLSELEIFPDVRFEVEAKSEELWTIHRFREVREGLHLEAVLVVIDEEGIVVAEWNIIEAL